jgi:Bacterial CdiA-CT RNAse A domain
MHRRLPISWAVLAFTLCVLVGCQSPPAQESQAAPAARSSQAPSGPVRDLSQDEAAGGHTLKKHVGRTDEQLRERLRRERNISAASTYTDLEAAERAVGVALEQNQAKIQRWLNREGGHPNLVVDYDGDAAHPIGRTMNRGDDESRPCSHAIVVLKWDGDRNYHVLTTYPECR